MVINIDSELEAALKSAAQRKGVTAEDLALGVLRERFLQPFWTIEPQDEWERNLLAAASDCGVSLPNIAVSSEGLYD